MKRVKSFVIVFFSLLPFMAFSPYKAGVTGKVEIVFCLDMSGSTNGLLNDIRDNIWDFINDFHKNNPETDLKIGLVGFARPSFGYENDYVRILNNPTEDFDFVSWQLNKLKVNLEKGDQYVGSALYTACKELKWSRENEARKLIFLFGNGSVRAGRYDYRKACYIALEKNITINPVYTAQSTVNGKELGGWESIAELTGGSFYIFRITKRSPLKRISADAQWLIDFNEKIYDTYIYFGRDGQMHYELMQAADKNALRMGEQYFYSRCRYKATEHYEQQNMQWDLVSRMKTLPVDLERIDRRYLPDEVKKIPSRELKELIEIKQKRRENLMTGMEKTFITIPTDTLAITPFDSIFSGGMNIHF
ncbi:MAG: VWA domain-containing protein [Bacteroidia bacterium]